MKPGTPYQESSTDLWLAHQKRDHVRTIEHGRPVLLGGGKNV
jgi:hypothetical protein